MRRKLKFTDLIIGAVGIVAFMFLVAVVVAGLFVLVRGTWLDDGAFILPALIVGFAVATLTLCGITAIWKGFLKSDPPAWWEGDSDTR